MPSVEGTPNVPQNKTTYGDTHVNDVQPMVVLSVATQSRVPIHVLSFLQLVAYMNVLSRKGLDFKTKLLKSSEGQYLLVRYVTTQKKSMIFISDKLS